MKTSFEQKIAALEAAGLDVNAFMSLASSLGLKTEEDFRKGSVSEQVFANGYVKNTKLHRRFVMAHMFNLLFRKNNWGGKCNDADHEPKKNFNMRVAKRGLKYSWKMSMHELEVQIKLRDSDKECYEERSRVFDCVTVLIAMAEHYMKKLKREMRRQEKAGLHKFKGQPYYTIGGHHYLVEDMQIKIDSLKMRQKAMYESRDSLLTFNVSAARFFNAIPQFNRINQCPEWLNAFKGAGAFYTMQNMIRFHGCTIDGMDMKQSEARLNQWAEEHGATGGFILFAKLIDFIEENNFDFYKRMKEVYSK